MTIKVIAPPAFEPVSLAMAKLWCRTDEDSQNAEDATLEMLIRAMRETAEDITGRAFIPRTLRLTLPCWPAAIELPHPPLREVLEIRYITPGGTTEVLATSQYTVHDEREPALIVPAWGVYWPATRAVMNAVQIDYIAGYAPVGSPADEAAHQAAMPGALRTWLHARIATLFEQREQLLAANTSSAPQIPRAFADGLLDGLVIGSRLF